MASIGLYLCCSWKLSSILICYWLLQIHLPTSISTSFDIAGKEETINQISESPFSNGSSPRVIVFSICSYSWFAYGLYQRFTSFHNAVIQYMSFVIPFISYNNNSIKSNFVNEFWFLTETLNIIMLYEKHVFC